MVHPQVCAKSDAFGKRREYRRKLLFLKMKKSALLVGLHRTYMGDIERGKKNVTLVTADKLVRGLGLTLVSQLFKMEQNLDDQERVTAELTFYPRYPRGSHPQLPLPGVPEVEQRYNFSLTEGTGGRTKQREGKSADQLCHSRFCLRRAL